MNKFKLFSIIALVAIVLAACGPKATEAPAECVNDLRHQN